MRALLACLLIAGALAACSAPASPAPAAQATRPAATPAATTPAASAAAPAAAPTAPAAPTSPPAPETVTISWVPSLTIAPFYVAMDRGYFAEQGIELKLEQVQSAADAIAFLANGQLDLSAGAVAVALYNAIAQGLDVRIVAPSSYDRADQSTPLIVRKELVDSGAVRQVADLRGKRIYSVAPGSGAAYLRIKALEKAGLRDSDIELTTMQLADAPVAFANGVLDGGLFPEPWNTRIQLEYGAVILDPAPAPGTLVTTIMAGERMRRERADLGRRWMLAYLKGTRDLQTMEQLTSGPVVESLARWTGLPADVVRQVRTWPRWDANLAIDADNLLDQQRVHLAAGAARYPEPLPAARLIDAALAEWAVAQLGRQ